MDQCVADGMGEVKRVLLLPREQLLLVISKFHCTGDQTLSEANKICVLSITPPNLSVTGFQDNKLTCEYEADKEEY